MGSNHKYENGVSKGNGVKLESESEKEDVAKITDLTQATLGNPKYVVKVNHHESPNKENPPDPNSSSCFRTFVQGVKEDVLNKDLIALKVLFFFKYATVFVLYPFLTLHLKSLGLTATEAGWNSALIPVIAIFGPPLAGIIADRIGNFKLFLAGITLLNAPLALALLFVPKARETVQLPELLTFSMGCGSPWSSTNATVGGDLMLPFTLKTLDSSICSISPTLDHDHQPFHLPPAVLQCGQICSSAAVNSGTEYPPLGNLPVFINSSFLLPDNQTFFIPFPNKKPRLICNPDPGKCIFTLTDDSNSSEEDVEVKIKFNQSTFRYLPKENRTSNADAGTEGNLSVNVTNPEFLIDGPFNFGNTEAPLGSHCSADRERIRSDGSRDTPGSDVNCRNECLVQLNRTYFCSNREEEKIYNVALTFGVYTVFRVLWGLFSQTAFIMFEGAVLAILKEYGGDYGLQRVTATIAAVIFSPLSGALIEFFNGFTAAFILYTVLQIICAVLTLTIDLRFKPPAEKLLRHLKQILSQVELLIFFVAIFVSGTAWGYLESFLFWFLKDLGAKEIMMGLTISVGGLAGIPFLILSKPIIAKFGHVNIMCLGLLFYGFRLIGYSYIENPWWCLPYEAMEALTASLAITAAATYAASLSTKVTITSIQGIWGGLYFGIGRSSGSLFGGYFNIWYGSRGAFQIFATMSFIGAAIYYLLNIFFLKEKSRLRQKAGAAADEEENPNARDNPAADLESETEKDKFEPCYIVPCDIDKFTNIPLDEDTPEGKLKFEKVRPRNNNNKKGKQKADRNSAV